jgi:hypothetical protein
LKQRYFPGVTSGREDGSVVIFVVCAIAFMFISITALAIDSGHMVMVKNELQNAADAGALAGAALLFNPDGSINTDIDTDTPEESEGENVARANPEAGIDSAKTSTETDYLDVVVEIGHWSFKDEHFEQIVSGVQLDSWEGMSAEDLDGKYEFINAVKVTTTRENTATIFAGFFGMFDTKIETDAVAYIGFTSTIDEGTVDIPFAICLGAFSTDGAVNCGVARASNEGIETGGWTNFSQDGQETFPDGCDSVNTGYMKTLLEDITTDGCSGLNPDALKGGEAIGTSNGVVDTNFRNILDNCFTMDPSEPWKDVSMPVVNCADVVDFAGGSCDASEVTFAGIINVDIIWMSNGKKDVPINYVSIPPHGGSPSTRTTYYEAWDCDIPIGETDYESKCWVQFQDHYDYRFEDPEADKDPDDNIYRLPEKNGIYLSPNCDYVQAAGSTGSFNMGVMAAIPVLVE